ILARNDAVKAQGLEAAARKLAEDRRIEAQRKAARLAFDRGVALCQQGQVGQGMLWLARTLELAPAEEKDLIRVARTNLASWGTRLAPLRAMIHHGGQVASLSRDGKLLL